MASTEKDIETTNATPDAAVHDKNKKAPKAPVFDEEAINAIVEARIKAILDKKEEDIKAKMSLSTPAEVKPAQDNYLEERVCVEVFRDNDKYKDDVFLQINGENCVIQRGKPVWIKRKFALLLDQSKIASYKAAQFQDKQAEELEKIKARGA